MRGARVLVAVGLAAGVGAAAIGLGAGASADVEPEQAVQQAAENLSDLPSSVTVDGPGDEGEMTLARTEDGASVTVKSAQGNLDATMQDEQLYLRVDGGQLPPDLALLGALPSFKALLAGQWVSLDVSQDSDVLAALQSAGAAGDTAAMRAAGEQLQASLESIGESLREPMSNALQDNSGVVKVDDHYRVTLDRAAASAALEPALRSAFEQALAAMDTFAAQTPDAAMWQEKRAEIVSGFDQAMAQPKDTPATMDVWIADGRFTKIVAQDVTMNFTDEASVEVPADAVPMDKDLITVLQFLPKR